MLLRHGRALVGLSKDVQQNEICCSLAYGRVSRQHKLDR